MDQEAKSPQKYWGWILIAGILLVVLGIYGLSAEVAVTIATIYVFGVLSIIAGIITFASVFMVEGWKGKLWNLLIGLVYAAAGIVMIMYPAASAIWVTLLIAAFVLVIGVFRLISGVVIRDIPGSGWTILSGIAGIILGVLLFIQWPVSGLWAIGMFVSIDFIFQGISFISTSIALKKS